MTKDEARRASILARAWEDVEDWLETVGAAAVTAPGYTQCVMAVGVWQTGDDPSAGGSGAKGTSEIYVDMATARKLAPIIRDAIKAELSSLGVVV